MLHILNGGLIILNVVMYLAVPVGNWWNPLAVGFVIGLWLAILQ